MGAKEIAVDSRRERKKEETRQVIVRAAMDLFDAQGFASTTMEQIAACADVAKGTLYNYFPVKEAIVATFMRYSAREAAPELAALLAAPVDTRARLKAVFHKVAQWQQPHRELLEPYISYRMGQMLESLRHPELRSGFGHNLAAVLEKGREGGEIRGDLPLPTLTAALETAYLTVILNWLVDEGSELVPALERMIDLFLDGAAAPGGRP